MHQLAEHSVERAHEQTRAQIRVNHSLALIQEFPGDPPLPSLQSGPQCLRHRQQSGQLSAFRVQYQKARMTAQEDDRLGDVLDVVTATRQAAQVHGAEETVTQVEPEGEQSCVQVLDVAIFQSQGADHAEKNDMDVCLGLEG